MTVFVLVTAGCGNSNDAVSSVRIKDTVVVQYESIELQSGLAKSGENVDGLRSNMKDFVQHPAEHHKLGTVYFA